MNPSEAMLNTEDMGGESAQQDVAGARVMDLLKELETALKKEKLIPWKVHSKAKVQT